MAELNQHSDSHLTRIPKIPKIKGSNPSSGTVKGRNIFQFVHLKTLGQCYKTSFVGDLQIFVIS
jgi:hypothetical protein